MLTQKTHELIHSARPLTHPSHPSHIAVLCAKKAPLTIDQTGSILICSTSNRTGTRSNQWCQAKSEHVHMVPNAHSNWHRFVAFFNVDAIHTVSFAQLSGTNSVVKPLMVACWPGSEKYGGEVNTPSIGVHVPWTNSGAIAAVIFVVQSLT